MGKKLKIQADMERYMYAGRYKNKELFWKHVKETQAARRQLKLAAPIEKNLAKRYASKIPAENFEQVMRSVMANIRTPLRFDFVYLAGSPCKSKYAGSQGAGYYKGQHSSTQIQEHVFEIYAGRVVRNDLPSTDGIMHTTSRLVKTVAGVKLYRAVWTQNVGRSYGFEFVYGFVAEFGGVYYHASTPKLALAGLDKKRKKKFAKLISSNKELGKKEFMALTGACEMGCNTYMAQQGLEQTDTMSAANIVNMLASTGQKTWADKLASKLIQEVCNGAHV